MNGEAITTEAERELKAGLMKISGEMETRVLPTALVESIYSYELAEDGKTLVVMVDMADGSTAMISVCPGQPIAARVVSTELRSAHAQ